ncbi:MAG TPA: Fic family protein [Streptosporangiaceae bacterium]|jgi:hypothetical protein
MDVLRQQWPGHLYQQLLREQVDPRPPGCRTPEDSARCRCGAEDRIAQLGEIIDNAARVIDAKLAHPARWRGQTRRALLGYCVGDEATRYRETFNWVVTTDEPVSEDYLIELHQRAVGWRDYRTCHLWVDYGYRHPEPEEIPRLLGLAFDRLNDAGSMWPAAALALGLHLDLVTAHPFSDGNGRTARLAASSILASHGYKSTLMTAVEQFFHLAPRRYLELLDHYRFARACRMRTIEQLLIAMAASSAAAAWAKANRLLLTQVTAIDDATPSPGRLPTTPGQLAHHALLAQLQRIDIEERDPLGPG